MSYSSGYSMCQILMHVARSTSMSRHKIDDVEKFVLNVVLSDHFEFWILVLIMRHCVIEKSDMFLINLVKNVCTAFQNSLPDLRFIL